MMLLVVSGEGQVVLEELKNKAMIFFAIPNSKATHIYLNSVLESEKDRCSVSPTMANNLFIASFR